MNLALLAPLALAALPCPAFQDDVLRVPPSIGQDTRTPVDVQPEETTLRFYEVSDLVRYLQFAEPEADAPAESEEARRARAQASTAALARLLARHVEPPLAEGASEQMRAGGPGVLIVMGRAAQHAWVERVLTLQRQGNWLLHLQVRYFEGPRGAFSAFAGEGSAFLLEDALQIQSFLRHGEGPGMNVLVAPQVLTRALEHAQIEVMNEVAYIKEYRLVIVEPGAKEIADPVIDTLREGHSFGLRGIVLEEGLVGLDLELTRSQVERPIPTRKVRLSPAVHSEVEVSTPVVFTATIAAEMALAEDTAVVFLSPANDEQRDLACIVTVKAIRGEPMEAPEAGAPAPPAPGERRDR